MRPRGGRRATARLREAFAGVRSDDAGNAVVEFLGVALVLLVPTVYLVLVLGRLQSAAFAVDGAAREAVRAYVTTAARGGDPTSRAVTAVHVALADQGLADAPAAEALALACAATCAPGDDVVAQVEVAVPLPAVPGWLQDVVPLVVPVSATATGVLDAYVAGS